MLDKVVTSTDLTYTDRLGGEHYTVDGMKAEGDKVVEETRQNLIPLSRQYMTLEAAQADIANIPDGSTTYVRSPDGGTLADEYINNGGTLAATGRHMPSQVYVDTQIAVVDKRLSDNDGPVDITDELDYIDKYVIYADGTVDTNGDGWRGLFVNVRKGEHYTYKGSMGSIIPGDNIAVMWQLDSAGNKVAPLVSMVSTGVVQADQEYSATATMDGLIYIRARSRDASGELTPFSVISNRPYYVPGKYFDRISGEASVTLGQITEGKFFRELGA
ncbi:MAG: hypothetical protein E7C46_22710, partial [Klebsiella grimontii]|nr:hypothetical protein [Klebsiella grimontii]